MKLQLNFKNINYWKYLDIFLLIISLALAFIAFKVITNYYSHNDESIIKIDKEFTEKEIKTVCENCEERNLDGLPVKNGEENLLPLAVIIENHTEARPQVGLADANIVFEAEAEGGITRFLAIYDLKDLPNEIGPIRSARPYFLDWAKEFSALFVHVGGSPEALVKIAKDNIFNINEFYNEKYFWREDGRTAPHNVFSSRDLLQEYAEKREISTAKFFPWKFTSEENPNKEAHKSIFIDFKRKYYEVEWKYNKNDNSYTRYQGGEIHKTEDNKEINVKNVLVAFTETEVIDDKLRLKISTTGKGKAYVCNDGVCLEGEWKKGSSSSRLRFYVNGMEVKILIGKTWVEILKPEIKIREIFNRD